MKSPSKVPIGKGLIEKRNGFLFRGKPGQYIPEALRLKGLKKYFPLNEEEDFKEGWNETVFVENGF